MRRLNQLNATCFSSMLLALVLPPSFFLARFRSSPTKESLEQANTTEVRQLI